MKIFLTGATGYLGSALLERLCREGHEVYVLVRDEGRAKDFPTGVHCVPGNLLEPSSYREALKEMDAVFHVAAFVKVWTPDPTIFDRTNVEATVALIRNAVLYGVKKIFYTSSFIALGPSPDGRPLDETSQPSPPYFNHYHRTKAVALQAVRDLVKEGAPVVILYPGVIYGPGRMTAGNHVVTVIRDFARGRVPGFIGSGNQRWNFAYIEDVTFGHILALKKAHAGSEYILGGENKSMRELLEPVAAFLGRRLPHLSIPVPLAKVAAGLQFLMERMFSREPSISPGVVEIYARDWVFTSDKAVRDLGYSITPFAQGIQRTLEWMKSNGYIRA